MMKQQMRTGGLLLALSFLLLVTAAAGRTMAPAGVAPEEIDHGNFIALNSSHIYYTTE